MNKQLFIFFIIVLAIALFGWQFFWPEFKIVSQAGQDLKLWEEKLNETQSLSQKLAELKKKYEKMEPEAQRVAASLPEGHDIPALLVQLEAVTSQNGLILNSVGFNFPAETKKKKTAETEIKEEGVLPAASPAAPADIKSMVVELSLSGNYNALKNFLKATESSLRIMDITAINFGAASQTETSFGFETAGSATFTVSLNVYYR